MPKLPDVSGYSFDELSRLVALATKRMEEIRGKRIKELRAELDKLGGGDVSSSLRHRGKAVAGRKSNDQERSKRSDSANRKVPAQFRGPQGEEYSGRGAIPRWARELGVNDRADLEKYRIS